MARTSLSKNNVIARVQAFISGLELHDSGETLVLAGVSITVLALIAELKSYIALLNANTTTYDAWVAQTKLTRTTEVTEMKPRMDALGRYLRSVYGPQSSVLTDYGLKPAKTPKRSPRSKVTAAEKDEATRIARDTMGPRQKEAIHGTVPTEPVPPEPAPASNPVAPQVTAPGTPPKK